MLYTMQHQACTIILVARLFVLVRVCLVIGFDFLKVKIQPGM